MGLWQDWRKRKLVLLRLTEVDLAVLLMANYPVEVFGGLSQSFD